MKLNFENNFQRTWASTAVAGVSLGASIFKGIKANSADKAAANEGAALKRPSYQIPNEFLENRNIAGQQAQGGLSAAEKQYAGEQRERGLGSSLSSLAQTGGGPNEFAGLNKVFDDSLRSQSALDAQTHMQNIQFFTKANEDLAGQKATQWGINELQPYESKLKEIQDRRIAAQTNRNNAVNEGMGSLTAAATGVNSYLKTKGHAEKDGPNLLPYNRAFGLANVGATPGADPAASWNVLDPNAAAGVTAGI